MTVIKRLTGLFCAALLLLSAAGCGNNQPAAQEGFTVGSDGISAAAVLLTVDDIEIPADLYYYWLGYSLDYLDFSRYNGEGPVWSDTIDGMSAADYVKNDALQTIRLYAAAEQKANELGCGVDEATQNALAAAKAEYISSIGGEEQYQAYLLSLGLREESFLHLITVSLLCDQLMDFLYNEGGLRAPTQDSIDTFCAENGYYRVKYIRLSSTDEGGVVLPGEELAAQETLALDLARQLGESENPEELFGQLMQAYSQDPYAQYYPDGYVFSRDTMLAYDENYGQYLFEEGGMAEEIYNAAVALEPSEISEVVSCGNDWYLLLRLPIPLDLIRDAYCQADFSEQLTQWKEETQISFADAYDAVDPEAFYAWRLQAAAANAVG
jgi:hypothetical protein